MYRAAKVEDGSNIAALLVHVWLHTYATNGIDDAISKFVLSESTKEKIGENIETKQYFVCELDGHLVGVAIVDPYATCPVTQENLPELEKLYIQEHFARQGLGSGLLAQSIEYCWRNRFPTLWLSVNIENRRAQDFYKKLGFKKVGKTYFELGKDLYENDVLHVAIDPLGIKNRLTRSPSKRLRLLPETV